MRCAECETLSDDHAGGWRALLAQDPDEDPVPFVVVLCPRCFARELGWRPLLAQAEG
jgi:hypothetical protein